MSKKVRKPRRVFPADGLTLSEAEQSILSTLAENLNRDIYIAEGEGLILDPERAVARYWLTPPVEGSATEAFFIFTNTYLTASYNDQIGSLYHDRTLTVNTMARSGITIHHAIHAATTNFPSIHQYSSTHYWIPIPFFALGEDTISRKERDKLLWRMILEYFSDCVDLAKITDEAREALMQLLLQSRHSSKVSGLIQEIEDLRNSEATYTNSLIVTKRNLASKLKMHDLLIQTTEEGEDLSPFLKHERIASIGVYPSAVHENSYVQIKTKPILLSLPAGKVPIGSFTINIFETSVTVSTENGTHPHVRNDLQRPCWGGFSTTIVNALSSDSIGIAISAMMEWIIAYDPGSAYQHLSTAAQDRRIIIDESRFYDPGSNVDRKEEKKSEQKVETEARAEEATTTATATEETVSIRDL